MGLGNLKLKCYFKLYVHLHYVWLIVCLIKKCTVKITKPTDCLKCLLGWYIPKMMKNKVLNIIFISNETDLTNLVYHNFLTMKKVSGKNFEPKWQFEKFDWNMYLEDDERLIFKWEKSCWSVDRCHLKRIFYSFYMSKVWMEIMVPCFPILIKIIKIQTEIFWTFTCMTI